MDQPFATFRYYYRTWDQLQDLGFHEHCWHQTGEEDDLSVIEPYDGRIEELFGDKGSITKVLHLKSRNCTDVAAKDNDLTEEGSAHADDNKETGKSSHDTLQNTEPSRARRPPTPAASSRLASTATDQWAYIPSGAPRTGDSDRQGDEQMRKRDTSTRALVKSADLTASPAVKFDAPSMVARPLSRASHDGLFSSTTAYQPHPVHPVDTWTVRTLSPVKSVRGGISTPPLTKVPQARTGSSLMTLLTSTWRRRGTRLVDDSTTADT